jgi:hypothetical protein
MKQEVEMRIRSQIETLRQANAEVYKDKVIDPTTTSTKNARDAKKDFSLIEEACRKILMTFGIEESGRNDTKESTSDDAT